MKRKKTLALLLALGMCLALAACGQQAAPAAAETQSADASTPQELPAAAESTVAGTYTMNFSGKMGDETFTLTLNDDGSCHLELNPMLGPWDGSYSHDGTHVVIQKLENPKTAMGKTPDLWPEWFDGADGSCEADLNDDGSFTFVEREGGEAAPAVAIFPGMESGAEPGGTDGYTVWENEPYGAGSAQTFNAKGKAGSGVQPVMIVVPGGAFRFVDGGLFSTICDTLCEEGWLVVQLNYTVGADTYPQAVVDVKTAIQYVTDHANELEADPDRISVLGCSAGGYLAAVAAFSDADAFKADETDPNYSFSVFGLVDFFGATQWMTDALYADVGARAPESEWLGSDVSSMSKAERDAIDPLTWLDEDDVSRVWISHGTADTTMPILNSEQFFEGVRAVLGEENAHFEIIEGAGHEGKAFYSTENLLAVIAFLSE